MVEFIETLDESGNPVHQVAHAEGDIFATGPDVALTAPGALTVDLVERRMQSDSSDIHFTFPGGDLTADRLEVVETVEDDQPATLFVNTARRTILNYSLSESSIYSDNGIPEPGGSVFGSLRFDFSFVAMETERTTLEIIDGEPVRLECPDPTTITTATNTLTMPSCALAFDPPSLTGDTGVELAIGEDTRVEAASLILTYPPEGGMYVQFSGIPASNSESPGFESATLPERVTIYNPAGTFSAACITIEVREDGTNRIHATGSACFEIPLATITGTQSESASE
jgi:hypothetical protein